MKDLEASLTQEDLNMYFPETKFQELKSPFSQIEYDLRTKHVYLVLDVLFAWRNSLQILTVVSCIVSIFSTHAVYNFG